MKIYTRGGDRGETSLLGPERVRKDDPRIEAYGTVDELSSAIGVARAILGEGSLDGQLAAIQSDLFQVGSYLAATKGGFATVEPGRIDALEEAIDAMDASLPPLQSFILPGGSSQGAQLHLARTICRRAERRVVKLGGDDEAMSATIRYLNRLSDYLFVAARLANQERGVADVPWIAP
ncbi:MAG TPA: cob(I)yrinic acid a,c-diamide adenosyltransferase [Thermoanaerobaculia bacterium]|nr:cob(I)yrinic acid a,c-diamide adenosyltransferase [Thermoanaerobaculia bacterium]